MCRFKKKKIYKLTWQYSPYSKPYTELVKAYDPVHAWKIIKREHCVVVNFVSIEEI